MNNKKIHCRLCLIECTTPKPKSIFNKDDGGAKFDVLISKHLNLQIDSSDNYSTVICQNCSRQLWDFDNFCVYIKRCQLALEAVTNKQSETSVKSQNKPSFETLLFVDDDNKVSKMECDDVDDAENDSVEFEDCHTNDKRAIDYEEDDAAVDRYEDDKDETCLSCDNTTNWESEDESKTQEFDEHLQKSIECKQDTEIYRILNYTDMDDRYCTLCDKVFKNYNVLKGHMYNSHKDVKPFSCKICKEKVRSKRALRFHLITIHKFKLPKEKLDYLNKKKEERLQLEIMHNNDSQEFETNEEHNYSKEKDVIETAEDLENRTCPICEKTMKNFGVLKTHMVIVHKDIKMFSCEICKQKFRLHRYLRYHYRTNKECGQYVIKEPPRKNILQQHNDAHPLEDMPELNLTCAVCEREFKSIIALKSHMSSVHRGCRPYDCDICGLAFSLRPSLQRHYMKEEKCLKKKLLKKKYSSNNLVSISEFDPENRRCAICHTQFKTVMMLRAHMFKKHKDSHPFVCEKCGHKFRLRISLERHNFKDAKCVSEEQKKPKKKLTDLGLIEERTCGVCEAICKTPNALKAHMFLRHRGVKPFACEFCDLEFALRRSWTRHVQRVHFSTRNNQKEEPKEEEYWKVTTKSESPETVEVRWSFELQEPNEFEEGQNIYVTEELADENSSNIDIDSFML